MTTRHVRRWARARVRRQLAGGLAWRRWLRQRVWVARVRLQARASGADLDIGVADTAVVGPHVQVRCRPGTSNRVTIGEGARVDDDVLLQLDGGTVEIGPEAHLRRGVVLNVAGRLELHHRNILSWGTTVHCAERVVLEAMASASEYVTVTDSRHFHTAPDAFFYHHTESDPVRVGRNTWLASKSTVLMGSDIGDCSVLGAHSVFQGSAPDDSLLVGTPARRVRAAARDAASEVVAR
ncbi:hypothetical protein NHL50_04110 [Acidimicrobiia bacterium EGI L10123]|uniref:acyltransferase n=1 Tax=Salinilacustrithrix flava TaxID=2957203 RepID=UPI003D7C23CE|nr:hypothetical protein [Acidimicrobiia bacterium EGI L10123]